MDVKIPPMGIYSLLTEPWAWYVAGPLIGLTVPLLLLLGNKSFGISSSLQHICAMTGYKKPYFNYDWRKVGGWNLIFVLGIVLGGLFAGVLFANPEPLQVAASTQKELAAIGVEVDGKLVPTSLFTFANLFTLKGFLLMVCGGFFIGFGTRYADGCTSGHAITGLASLQLPSLIAVIGFFVGGLISTHFLLPLILSL
jgi:uncharacterized membrane protein YedE/YeeE